MIFFDTNLLIYATIDQSRVKLEHSRQCIRDAIIQDAFMISPLVFSEYIFTLAKYKLLEANQKQIDFFSRYIHHTIDQTIVLSAQELCYQLNACRNINDAIHLKTAEAHCDTLVTFDKDFARFQPHSSVDIKILS